MGGEKPQLYLSIQQVLLLRPCFACVFHFILSIQLLHFGGFFRSIGPKLQPLVDILLWLLGKLHNN